LASVTQLIDRTELLRTVEQLKVQALVEPIVTLTDQLSHLISIVTISIAARVDTKGTFSISRNTKLIRKKKFISRNFAKFRMNYFAKFRDISQENVAKFRKAKP
jgi:hypothetical protein